MASTSRWSPIRRPSVRSWSGRIADPHDPRPREQKKLGVAGGPLDKSWLLIQALAGRDHGIDLTASSDVVFGAPPLMSEKAMQGEFDAVLNFWHFCARLEANGFRRMIGANDAAKALGASGPVSALGYVFHDKWANENPAAVKGFIKASAQAKDFLAKSDDEWLRLAPIIRAEGKELETLRDRYREGIPRRPVAEEEADAGKLYHVLAAIGGEKLVGQCPGDGSGHILAGPHEMTVPATTGPRPGRCHECQGVQQADRSVDAGADGGGLAACSMPAVEPGRRRLAEPCLSAARPGLAVFSPGIPRAASFRFISA